MKKFIHKGLETCLLLIMLIVLLSASIVLASAPELEFNENKGISKSYDYISNQFDSHYQKELAAIQQKIHEKGLKWQAGETEVSKLPLEQRKKLLSGVIKREIPEKNKIQEVKSELKVSSTELPSYFDWRNKDGANWMTPVKNQLGCGSCWDFVAVGSIEAAFNIYQNNPDIDLDLSEQHILSCSGCGTCNGGGPGCVFSYAKDNGIPDEACFPYAASDLSCNQTCPDWQSRAVKIKDYMWDIPNTTESYKQAIMKYGPAVVVLYVPDDFLFYVGGIYEPIENVGGSPNHAVVLVGWNDTGFNETTNTTEGYWIIKNSWGTWWGENGYGKVAYGNLEKYDYIIVVTDIAGLNIRKIECQKNNSWVNCSDMKYNDYLTKIRVNCTNYDFGDKNITNVTISFKNNNLTIFEGSARYDNSGFWVYDNDDTRLSSGEFIIDAACSNETKTTRNFVKWNISFGILEPYLIYPTKNKNVMKNKFFNFISGVRCIGGDCGNVNATLDPYGPDGYNYTALNSSEPGSDPFEWEEIVTNGTAIWNGTSIDYGYFTIPIGFNFTFYNSSYATAYVSSNGRIHFTTNGAAYTSIELPSDNFIVIAPVNNDMYVRNNTKVFYKNYENPTRLVIEYNNLDHYSSSGNYITFEVIIYQNGKIKFQYNSTSGNYNDVGNNIGINYAATGNYSLLIGTNAPNAYKGMAVTFYPQTLQKYIKRVVPMNNGTPFYTIDGNPASCGFMRGGDSCEKAWRVNATGDLNSTYGFFVIYTSENNYKLTDIINITIVENITNNPPVIINFTPANTSLKIRGETLFNQTSYDPDGDDLVYKWYYDGMEKSNSSSWIFSPNECREHNITLIVSDFEFSVNQSWNITAGLQGDVDWNYNVNIFDLASVGICFGKLPGENCTNADLNNDGSINIFDLATVGINYGRNC